MSPTPVPSQDLGHHVRDADLAGQLPRGGVEADHAHVHCLIGAEDWDLMYHALLARITHADAGLPSSQPLCARQLHARLAECLADLAMLARSSAH